MVKKRAEPRGSAGASPWADENGGVAFILHLMHLEELQIGH